MGGEQRGRMVISSSPVLKENRRAQFHGQWNSCYTIIEENKQIVFDQISSVPPPLQSPFINCFHFFPINLSSFPFIMTFAVVSGKTPSGNGSMIQANAEPLGI